MNPYAFITKYDSAGTQQWIREPGLGGHEIINGVSTDGLGNVYGTGTTSPQGSAEDAFLVKYDTNGNKIWVQQFGSTQSERAYGVATDPLHNVFVTGVTYGAYASPNAGAGCPLQRCCIQR